MNKCRYILCLRLLFANLAETDSIFDLRLGNISLFIRRLRVRRARRFNYASRFDKHMSNQYIRVSRLRCWNSNYRHPTRYSWPDSKKRLPDGARFRSFIFTRDAVSLSLPRPQIFLPSFASVPFINYIWLKVVHFIWAEFDALRLVHSRLTNLITRSDANRVVHSVNGIDIRNFLRFD